MILSRLFHVLKVVLQTLSTSQNCLPFIFPV